MKSNLRARVVAEFLGTGFLVAAVVGSGIMAERLAGGNVALALLRIRSPLARRLLH
jgi:glycerol uptake facilitator-like aquaporin